MRIRIVAAAVSFLIPLSLFAQIQVPPDEEKWEISFLLGGAFAGDQSAATPIEGEGTTRVVGLNYDSGLLLGVRITENLSEYVAAEFDYTYANQPMKFMDLTATLPRLDLDHGIHSLIYSFALFPLGRTSSLKPFGSLGGGASYFWIRGDSSEEAAKLGVDVKGVWKFVLSWGGGVKYQVDPKWGIRFDFRDLVSGIPSYGLPKTSIGGTPAFRPSGNLHNWQVSGGISYYWSDR
jgi:opacity protein-like surface antigen